MAQSAPTILDVAIVEGDITNFGDFVDACVPRDTDPERIQRNRDAYALARWQGRAGYWHETDETRVCLNRPPKWGSGFARFVVWGYFAKQGVKPLYRWWPIDRDEDCFAPAVHPLWTYT